MTIIRRDPREPDDDNGPPVSVIEELETTEAQLAATQADNLTLRAALWEIHTLLTSDGADTVEPIDIIRLVERVLRWNGGRE